MPQGRVQVEDLPGPERIRVVQTAGDTFRGAEKPPVDPTAGELASALGKWSDTLSGLATAFKKDTKAKDIADAQMLVASSTNAEKEAAVKVGTIPLSAVPEARATQTSLWGTTSVTGFVGQFKQDVQSGKFPVLSEDGTPADYDTAFLARMNEYWNANVNDKYKADPHFRENWFKGANTYRKELQDAYHAEVSKWSSGKQDETVRAGMEAFVNDIKRVGPETPEGRALANDYYLNLNKNLAGPGYPRITQQLLGVLQNKVDTDPDLVARMIDMDRGRDQKGQPLGSLRQNPLIAETVRDLDTKINQRRMADHEVAVKNAYVGIAVQALNRRDGSFYQLEDKTYGNPFDKRDPAVQPIRTLHASEIQKQALLVDEQSRVSRLVNQGVNGNALAENVFNSRKANYMDQGISNDVWKAELDSGVAKLSPTVAPSPEAVQQFQAGFSRYQQLKQLNEGYVRNTLGIKSETRDAYDAFEALTKAGADPGSAMEAASIHASGQKVPLDDKAKAKIEATVNSAGTSWFNLFTSAPVRDAEPIQPIAMKREVSRLAEVIASTGKMDPEKAAQVADTMVKEKAVRLNGALFLHDPVVTQETVPYIQKRLNDIATQFSGTMVTAGGPVTSGSDLTLVPDGIKKGVYRVIMGGSDGVFTSNPGRGLPVDVFVDGKRKPLTITAQEINLMKTQEQDKTTARIQASAVEERDQKIIEADNAFQRFGGKPTYTPEETAAAKARDAARREANAKKAAGGISVGGAGGAGEVPYLGAKDDGAAKASSSFFDNIRKGLRNAGAPPLDIPQQ